MESKEEITKSQIAIRCAKAAILLHALKSSPYRCSLNTSGNEQLVGESAASEILLSRAGSCAYYFWFEFWFTGGGDDVGEDEKRYWLFEGGVGEGANEEQEDQVVWLNGVRSSGYACIDSLHILFGTGRHLSLMRWCVCHFFLCLI